VVTALTVGPSIVEDVRQRLAAYSSADLARHLIGGLTRAELEGEDVPGLECRSLTAYQPAEQHFILNPLPNTLFQRDASAWLYGGVTLNPPAWHARRRESVNEGIIYRYHAEFRDTIFDYWYPRQGDAGAFDLEASGQPHSRAGT
jgi:arginine deiminase